MYVNVNDPLSKVSIYIDIPMPEFSEHYIFRNPNGFDSAIDCLVNAYCVKENVSREIVYSIFPDTIHLNTYSNDNGYIVFERHNNLTFNMYAFMKEWPVYVPLDSHVSERNEAAMMLIYASTRKLLHRRMAGGKPSANHIILSRGNIEDTHGIIKEYGDTEGFNAFMEAFVLKV